MGKRLAAGLVALLAALLPACSVGAAPRVVSVGDAVLGAQLTVVTYNVLHGFGDRLNDDTLDARLAILVDALAASPPDVIILQEASRSTRHGSVVDLLRTRLNQLLLPGAAPYSSAELMGNGSALIGFFEGSAILARARILSADALFYQAQALAPPERRVALRATIAGTPGPVVVIGTHLTNTDARSGATSVRALQAQELARWIGQDLRGLPIVVGGDFNASPGSAPIRAMTAAGGRDLWPLLGNGPGLTALDGTVRRAGDRATERIDYLFAFGPWRAGGSAELFLDRPSVDGTGAALWASDHVGVRAVISR